MLPQSRRSDFVIFHVRKGGNFFTLFCYNSGVGRSNQNRFWSGLL